MVSLAGVSRSYTSPAEVVTAVDDVTLQLDAGRLTALIGPSGSGKTTLINLIVGWEEPDRGAVSRHPDIGNDWKSVAIVPQSLGLLPELTLFENIQLPAALADQGLADIDALAEALELTAVLDQVPDAVSLGEHQRAAIARALVPSPRLLVADEPTAHQDEAHALFIAGMLSAAAQAGSAVLMATHDPRLLAEADTIIELSDGRLLDG